MSDGPRILWLTPDKPANISVGRQRIADHLESRGFDVVLRGTTARTLLRTLRERGAYDAIIGTTRAGAIAGALLKPIHRRPLVVDHIDPIEQFYETHPRWLAIPVRYLEAAAFRVADRALYVYETEHERVASHADSFEQTELGVEYGRFADPDEEIVHRASNRLGQYDVRDNIAVYVGGLEPIYHIEEMLAAFERFDDWSLLVLGDGSLRSSVEAAAESMDNVVFLGTVPHEDVPGYLAHADVGISLVDDPHTLKILEYAAAGLPIVQRGGAADERLDGLATFCDPAPEDIARAVRDASANPEALRAFASEYSWAAISDDYERVISSVLDDTTE